MIRESIFSLGLQNAIRYFENLYYSHNSYLSPFVIKLVLHYQKLGQYNEAKIVINSHLKRSKQGSTTWFKYMKTACLLYFSSDEMKRAENCIAIVLENDKFQNLTEKEKSAWKKLWTTKG